MQNKGEQIEDGTFQTACSNACTTGAMVFGDVNDKNSKVSALPEDDRMPFIGTCWNETKCYVPS